MNYIPLQKKRKSNCDFMSSSSKKARRMKQFSFGGDNRILHRIKELMDVSADEDQLLSDLQDTYPEYRRKKRGDLRAAIKKAVGLFAVDDGNSNEGCSSQSVVNDVDFSHDERYVGYESARSVKTKSNQSKEYLQEKEIVTITDDHVRNGIKNDNMCSPNMYVIDKRPKALDNSAQGSNMKDSEVQKSQKISRNLKKQENKGPVPQYPAVTFSDIGGQASTLLKISKLLMPLKFPKLFSSKRAKRPPCGILLHGPPGCGKTLLAHAVAGEMKLPLIEVAATDLISGISGDSEEKIRNLFEQAVNCSPCILFIDEVDAITSKREFTSRGMEKRVVSQLLKSMDDLRMRYTNSRVLVIGATNTPDAIDPAFRRGGRFGREIAIGIPDEANRVKILQVVCKDLQLSPDFDFQWLAKRTPGYVGADLAALVEGAVNESYNRILQKLCLIFESDSKMQNRLLQLMNEAGLQVNSITEVSKEFCTETVELIKYRTMLSVSEDEADPLTEKLIEEFDISVKDFEASLDTYVPCSTREGFATVPSVPWSRVGGLKDVQQALQKAIVWPLRYKEACDKFKYTPPSGMLLWGPKGCGKTLLAKAVASECGINFIPVKGPELLNMYLGESERAVRQVFQRARNSAPCVVLFDELDALCSTRSNSSGNTPTDRVVNQLLCEMDGTEAKTKIFIIATTNRIENIDSAMLRPGRLARRLYVGLPTPEERIDILKAITKNGTDPKLAGDVDLEALGYDSRCDGFSGADLESLLTNVSSRALEDYISGNINDTSVSQGIPLAYFDLAFTEIKPSVSEEERKYFETLKLSQERTS